ncbi:unnamed protein product [Debaryomyces tyrocola]|nr:unnamed protein product [Debaryomyces tyrocola]
MSGRRRKVLRGFWIWG